MRSFRNGAAAPAARFACEVRPHIDEALCRRRSELLNFCAPARITIRFRRVSGSVYDVERSDSDKVKELEMQRRRRTTRDFLMQTYDRDMGDGKLVTCKEVDVPIRVRGRHWGGLRLVFRA